MKYWNNKISCVHVNGDVWLKWRLENTKYLDANIWIELFKSIWEAVLLYIRKKLAVLHPPEFPLPLVRKC